MAQNRRVRRLAVAVLTAALATTACSGGGAGARNDEPPANGPAPTGQPSTGSGFDAASFGVANPSTATGGELHLGSAINCDSWDPQRTYFIHCWNWQRLFTRQLLTFGGAPGTGNLTPVPDLATALGEHNADFTRWTYHLKPDIKWEDGTPITSRDIKYGISRLFAINFLALGPAGTYLCLLSSCNSRGIASYRGPYEDTKAGVPSIETPDDRTVVFHLTSSYAQWDRLMTLPAAAPVPAGKDTGASYGLHPVASGPYKIESYQPGKSIRFIRNSAWLPSTDTVRVPKLDSIDLTILAKADDLDQRIEQGSLDLLDLGSPQPAWQARIMANPELIAYADNPHTTAIRYLALAPSVRPLDNVHCRRAIHHALDKVALIEAHGGPLTGSVAGSMAPPGVPGHDPGYDPYPSGLDGTGDLDRARTELRECGRPDGFEIGMAYPTIDPGPKVFKAVQSSLGRVGIKVIAKPDDGSKYYVSFAGSPDTVRKEGLGIILAAWGWDFPGSIERYWKQIADSRSILPVGNRNYPSLDDPRINRALDQTRTSIDQEAAGKQINRYVMESAVYLPYAWEKRLIYRGPRATNAYVQYGTGYYDIVNFGVSDAR